MTLIVDRGPVMDSEMYRAVADALDRGERRRSSPSSRPTARRRSAWAPRCSSSPTAAPRARSAAAATSTTRSARRARRFACGRPQLRALHAERRSGGRDRADLRGTDGRLHRADRAGAHLYLVGAGHVSLRTRPCRPRRCGFRLHVLDDREKFASDERFPGARGRRRRHSRLAGDGRRFPPTPSSSSSRAAIATTSTRCVCSSAREPGGTSA